jgi:FkbM family methyltransferase
MKDGEAFKAMTLPFSLLVKSRIVGTPLEDLAKDWRWLLSTRQRAKHPELWELYLEEKRLPAVLKKLLEPTSCGVDVGAHIGSFLSLLVRYAPQGYHTAIEPSATKSRWLERKFPAVTVMPVAVSNENGNAVFEEDQARPGYSRLRGEAASRDALCYEVETRRLDDLCIKRVDLLKLDVEGAELLALRGATQLINSWRPAILFECGSEYAPEKINRRDLYHHLNEVLGYDVFSFTDFLFREKGALSFDEFRKCGIYPFRAFNFVALPR